jgi:hypothetical protein
MTVIEVWANPYIALDKDGVPQGTVATPGYPNSHVGATLDQVASQRTGKERFYFALGRDGSPTVRVGFTAEIAAAVRAGELIAVDEKVAQMCGIRKKSFLSPEAALDRERERALAYRQSLLGKDAELKPIPREATPAAEGEDEEPRGDRVKLTPTLTLNQPPREY